MCLPHSRDDSAAIHVGMYSMYLPPCRFFTDLPAEEQAKMLKERLKKYTQKASSGSACKVLLCNVAQLLHAALRLCGRPMFFAMPCNW